jgi:hypothetical protein
MQVSGQMQGTLFGLWWAFEIAGCRLEAGVWTVDAGNGHGYMMGERQSAKNKSAKEGGVLAGGVVKRGFPRRSGEELALDTP